MACHAQLYEHLPAKRVQGKKVRPRTKARFAVLLGHAGLHMDCVHSAATARPEPGMTQLHVIGNGSLYGPAVRVARRSFYVVCINQRLVMAVEIYIRSGHGSPLILG